LNRFRIAVRPRTAKPLPTDDAQIRIEGLHSYTRARENVSEPRRLSPPRSGPCRPLTPSSGPWRVPDVGSWLRPTTRYCALGSTPTFPRRQPDSLAKEQPASIEANRRRTILYIGFRTCQRQKVRELSLRTAPVRLGTMITEPPRVGRAARIPRRRINRPGPRRHKEPSPGRRSAARHH